MRNRESELMQTTPVALLSSQTARVPDREVPRGAFSVAEFTRAYNIGITTAYAERKAGRLRMTKVGRRTIVTAGAIQDWLAALEAEQRVSLRTRPRPPHQ